MSSAQKNNQEMLAKELLEDYVDWAFSQFYTTSDAPDPHKLTKVELKKDSLNTVDMMGYDMMVSTGTSIYSVAEEAASNLSTLLESVPLQMVVTNPPEVCAPCRTNCTNIPPNVQCLTGAYPPRSQGDGKEANDQVGLPTCDLCYNPNYGSCKSAICSTSDRPKTPDPLTGKLQSISSETGPGFANAANMIALVISSSPTPVYYFTNHPKQFLGLYQYQSRTSAEPKPETEIWRLFQVSLQSPPLSPATYMTLLSGLSNSNLTTFLTTNMKWLRMCCVGNQLLDDGISAILCGKTYRSDIYGLPTKVCDLAAQEYCVAAFREKKCTRECQSAGASVKDIDTCVDTCKYRNQNDLACSCFPWSKDGKSWRGKLEDSLDNDLTLGDGYDSAMYKFLSSNNPTTISRKCIVNNCKDPNAYKTAEMIRAKCPHMCTSILHNSLDEPTIDSDNNSNVDISNTTVTVKCGTAQQNFSQGAGHPPGYKPSLKSHIKWWVYLIIGLVVAGVIGGVVIFVIVRRKRGKK